MTYAARTGAVFVAPAKNASQLFRWEADGTTGDPIKHPIIDPLNAPRRQRVLDRFPQLAGDDSSVLALADYFERGPSRYFDEQIEARFLAWLSEPTRRPQVAATIAAERERLERAFRTLAEINAQDWHEEPIGDDLEQLALLEQSVHPAYLRLVEGPLNSFLRIAAIVSRTERGASTAGLDVFNVIQELEPHGFQFESYENIIRNGIAHAGVSYRQSEVRYTDKKGSTRELPPHEIVQKTDDLVDACNGLALALKVLLLGGVVARDDIPREVLLQELQAAASAPWWSVQACLPLEIAGGQRQLNILVKGDTNFIQKMVFSAMHTAALAERFSPGFDRYLIGLKQSDGLPGWAAFDGVRLRELRESGAATIEDYGTAMEKNGVFFVPPMKLPSSLNWFETMGTLLPTIVEKTQTNIRRELGLPSIEIRNLHSHRDPWLVVNADVVVHDATVDVVRKSAASIVSECVARARLKFPAKGIFPLGFARIVLFSKVHRDRRLRSYGLGPHLIARVTNRRDSRKLVIDLHGSRLESLGGLRVEWNSNWVALGDHLVAS